MTQEIVYKLLEELGGYGTTQEVTAKAIELELDLTNHKKVGLFLYRLKKRDYVDYDINYGKRMKARVYKIINPYP